MFISTWCLLQAFPTFTSHPATLLLPWRVCRGPRRFPWWCFWSRWSHSVSEEPPAGRTWLPRGAAGEEDERRSWSQTEQSRWPRRVCGGLAGIFHTSMTSVFRMCRDSVPPQYRYCMTSWKGTTWQFNVDIYVSEEWRWHNKQPYVENVVLDVADLDTGVLRSRPVLEQRLKPEWNRKESWVMIHAWCWRCFVNSELTSSPGWSCEEQHFVCIKGFPLHQEGDIRHLLVVQEVGICKKKNGWFMLSQIIYFKFNINVCFK